MFPTLLLYETVFPKIDINSLTLMRHFNLEFSSVIEVTVSFLVESYWDYLFLPRGCPLHLSFNILIILILKSMWWHQHLEHLWVCFF